MSDASAALIDSNVIIDVIGQDPVWRTWSVDALSARESAFVNPLVFAELCYVKPSPTEVETLLNRLEIGYCEVPKDALFLAAQAYKLYRRRGGAKTAPLPDFFIGAHAVALDVPIVTRDASRYQTYFPTAALITP